MLLEGVQPGRGGEVGRRLLGDAAFLEDEDRTATLGAGGGVAADGFAVDHDRVQRLTEAPGHDVAVRALVIVGTPVVEAELVAQVLGQIAFEARDEAGHRTFGLIAAIAHIADAAAEADYQVFVGDARMLGAHSGGQSRRHNGAGDRYAVAALVVAIAVEVAAIGQLINAELVLIDGF
ncbi:hypothetical protein D3C86_1453960 [compost metagenome]